METFQFGAEIWVFKKIIHFWPPCPDIVQKLRQISFARKVFRQRCFLVDEVCIYIHHSPGGWSRRAVLKKFHLEKRLMYIKRMQKRGSSGGCGVSPGGICLGAVYHSIHGGGALWTGFRSSRDRLVLPYWWVLRSQGGVKYERKSGLLEHWACRWEYNGIVHSVCLCLKWV